MARGTQLLQLVTMLRDEVGRSNSVAVGVDDIPSLKATIRRMQETLYGEHTWRHLSTMFPRKLMQAGERFYDFPTEMDFDRLEEVALWWNGRPIPIDRGISFDEYAIHDSENNVRSDPVRAWDVRWTGAKEQIEVWPIPASTNAMGLQFKGIRKLRPLVQDSDVADLDDQMIVLYSAAEILARQDSPDAQSKGAMALARLQRLKNNAGTGGRTYNMAGPARATLSNKFIIRVR